MSPGGTGCGMDHLWLSWTMAGSLFFKGIERTCSMVWPFHFCGFIYISNHFQLLTGVEQPQQLQVELFIQLGGSCRAPSCPTTKKAIWAVLKTPVGWYMGLYYPILSHLWILYIYIILYIYYIYYIYIYIHIYGGLSLADHNPWGHVPFALSSPVISPASRDPSQPGRYARRLDVRFLTMAVAAVVVESICGCRSLGDRGGMAFFPRMSTGGFPQEK